MTRPARPPAIECTSLSVALGGRTIVEGVDLHIDSGVVCGLLGPNGSGKTTLLKALGGQLPHGGSIRWYATGDRGFGITALGLQSSGYHRHRKVKDHVRFLRLSGCVDGAAIDDLVERLKLRTAWQHKASALSFGQKQALNVLGTLAARARLYLLDEPFAGLDADRVAAVRDRIRELHSTGATVVVTSHDLAPVESLIEQVVVLRRGAVCFAGRRDEFLRHGEEVVIRIDCPDVELLAKCLRETDLAPSVLTAAAGSVTVRHADYRQVVGRVLASGMAFTGIAVNTSPLAGALARHLGRDGTA